MYEHTERVNELFAMHDDDRIGKVGKQAFIDVVAEEGFQNLVDTEEMQKLVMSHEKAKDQIDFELFLTGKKYISKQFLIGSFEKKKKKKKKKKVCEFNFFYAFCFLKKRLDIRIFS